MPHLARHVLIVDVRVRQVGAAEWIDGPPARASRVLKRGSTVRTRVPCTTCMV